MKLAAVMGALAIASLSGCGLLAGLGSDYVAGDAGAVDGPSRPDATDAPADRTVDSTLDTAEGALADSVADVALGPDAPDADGAVTLPESSSGDSAAGGDASDGGAGIDSTVSPPDADASDDSGQDADTGATGNDVNGSYTVGGTLSGLGAGQSVTLRDNGSDIMTLTSNGMFTFMMPVANGTTYAVTVLFQPAGQFCTAKFGSGIGFGAPVTTVAVQCAPPEYTIGGTVTGLVTGDTLGLGEGGNGTLDVFMDGAFTFPNAVPGGTTYDVTVSSPPSSPPMTCTVTNGSSTVGASNVMSVVVDCTGKAVFAYTGMAQTWVVPSGKSSIIAKLWGAGGGGGGPGGWSTGYPGGAGGFTSATSITGLTGQQLTVIVGQGGAFMFPQGVQPTYGGGGGEATVNGDNRYGASGGGRSAILNSNLFELVTAGGGGGGGSSTPVSGTNAGGAGGGMTGQSGSLVTVFPNETVAGGGGQAAGGAGGGQMSSPCVEPATTFCGVSGNAGSQLLGGQCGYRSYGGGGGGGWFGGGSGVFDVPDNGSAGVMGGGGGGSGYVGGPGVFGSTTAGTGMMPFATDDSDYVQGVAIGGPVMSAGGNGLVVIIF